MLNVLVVALVLSQGPGLCGPSRNTPVKKTIERIEPPEEIVNPTIIPTPNEEIHQGSYQGFIKKVLSPLPPQRKALEPSYAPWMSLPYEDEGRPTGKMLHKWTYEELRFSNTKDPSMINHFDGISYTGWIPPDVQVAVNSSYVVELVNSSLKIFSKSGSALYTNTLSSFFSTLGPTINYIYDPKVAYDPDAGRWIVLALYKNSSDSTSTYYLAISQTSNPLGSWYFYALDATMNGSTQTNTWADYPGLGFNDWGIFITSNQYTWGDTFSYAKIRILDKASAYAGTLSSFFDIWGVDYSSSWKPAQCMSSSSTEYILRSYWGGSYIIRFWKLTGSATSPSLSSRYDLTVNTYQLPPNAVQPGGPAILDLGDCRIQDITYLNGMIYTTLTEEHPSDSTLSAIRYFEIDTTASVIKDVTLGNSSSNLFYPRVAASPQFSAIICGVSSTTEYAGLLYTTRDLLAGTFSSLYWIVHGSSYYQHYDSQGRNRWGDYFGAYYDPSDSSIWLAGEYANVVGNWNTYIAELKDTTSPGSPQLVVDSMIIDDDTLGNSNGNGNGMAESGEAVEMIMMIANNGSATATNVSAILTTNDTTITITDSMENYPNIPAGGGEWCYHDFDFYISSSAPTHYAEFYLQITSDQGTWTDTFEIPIYQISSPPSSAPFDLLAGDGFKNVVPLTWQDSSECTIYKVYRSQTSGGPYSLIATVDISQRSYYPSLDYLDESVSPGITYYYVVTAVNSGGESGPSQEQSATPSDTGWVLHSPYSDIPPIIDGVISDPEWFDAESVVISYPLSPYPIIMKIKNDTNYLYLAFIGYGNNTFIDYDEVGWYFDLGNDGVWPEDSSMLEGNFWFDSQYGMPSTIFRSIMGEYPDSLSFGEYDSAVGVIMDIDTSFGYLTMEVAIDMDSSMMKTFPGDTMGLWMFYSDDYNYATDYYGYIGYWPYGSIWAATKSYGELIIGEPIPQIVSDTLKLLPDTLPPGGSAIVPVQLINQNYVGGVQLTVSYDSTELRFDTLIVDSAYPNFTGSYNDFGDSVGIVIVSLQADSIAPGTNNIATILFSTDTTLSMGDSSELDIVSAIISDPAGANIPVERIGTWVFIYGVKGDLNQDGVVNVLDVVRAINIALGIPPSPTSYESWAADMNDDGTVNVLDIVAMINLSLGGPKLTSHSTSGKATVHVENNRIFVNSSVDVAGIQLELSGNPTNIRSLENNMSLFTNSEDNKTNVIMVSMNGNTLPSGSHPILSFDGDAIISKATLAAPGGEEIDVSSVKLSFELFPVEPNPVTSKGYLRFILPEASKVILTVYDISGRTLKSITYGNMNPGLHKVSFGAESMRSGVYFVQLEANGKRLIKKFVIR